MGNQGMGIPENEGTAKNLNQDSTKPTGSFNIGRTASNPDEPEPDEPDPWVHRSTMMRCNTCRFFLEKKRTVHAPNTVYTIFGRCRRHAPTMNGYPAVYGYDWCGDHKLDENKT